MDSLDNNRSRRRPLAPATKQLLEALQRELLEKCALENKSDETMKFLWFACIRE
jgi:FMN phosphatase YigB (HAD superfamily)